MSKYITAAYGTLRLGHGNYRWAYGSNNVECIAQATTLTGYKMRTHGGFPAIYSTDSDEDTVVVDVFDVATSTIDDPDDILDTVDSMEIGAGYDKRLVQLDNGMMAYVYTYTREKAHAQMQDDVDSGEWEVYCNE